MDPHLQALLAKRREPAIWFRTVEQSVSRSRRGGLPSLPDGVEWPVNGETSVPLHFMAQIDLSALPSTPLQDCPFKTPLPREGMLFFFFDCTQDMLGDEVAEAPSMYSRVIYAAGAGPDRAAPAALPMIGHETGKMGGDYAKPYKIFPVEHLRAYTIDTFWAPGYTVRGVYIQPLENGEDATAKFQSIVTAIGEDIPLYPTWEDVPSPAPSCHIFMDSYGDRREVASGLQMFGAETPWLVDEEAPRNTKKVLLLEIPLNHADKGSLLYMMKTSDLKAGRFDRVAGDAYFS